MVISIDKNTYYKNKNNLMQKYLGYVSECIEKNKSISDLNIIKVKDSSINTIHSNFFKNFFRMYLNIYNLKEDSELYKDFFLLDENNKISEIQEERLNKLNEITNQQMGRFEHALFFQIEIRQSSIFEYLREIMKEYLKQTNYKEKFNNIDIMLFEIFAGKKEEKKEIIKKMLPIDFNRRSRVLAHIDKDNRSYKVPKVNVAWETTEKLIYLYVWLMQIILNNNNKLEEEDFYYLYLVDSENRKDELAVFNLGNLYFNNKEILRKYELYLNDIKSRI